MQLMLIADKEIIMGMQCTFSLDDLYSFPMRTIHHKDSDTYSVEVIEASSNVTFEFNLSVPEDKQAHKYFCWFDVGSATDHQINCIRFLIRNRIPFNCA